MLQQEKSRVWFSLSWLCDYAPAARYSSNLLYVGQIKSYSIPSENKGKVRWQYKIEANSVYKQSKLWQREKTVQHCSGQQKNSLTLWKWDQKCFLGLIRNWQHFIFFKLLLIISCTASVSYVITFKRKSFTGGILLLGIRI